MLRDSAVTVSLDYAEPLTLDAKADDERLVLLAVKSIYEQSNWEVLGIRNLVVTLGENLSVEVVIENEDTKDRVIVTGDYDAAANQWTDRLLSESKADEALDLDAWRMDKGKGKPRGKRTTAPKCNKGRPCGMSCIAGNRNCRVNPQGAAEKALKTVVSGGGGGSLGGGSGSSGVVVSKVITTIRDEPVSGLPDSMKERMPNARSYSATHAFYIKGGNMDGTDTHVALMIRGGEFGPNDSIIRTRNVAFSVNGETLTTNTKPEVGSIISNKISEIFRASLLDFPDGTRVSTDAVTGDSRGDFRQAMYAKIGFSFAGGGTSPGDGEQFAIVRNGRLVPANDDFTIFSDAEQAEHRKAIRKALKEAIQSARAYPGAMNEDGRNDY